MENSVVKELEKVCNGDYDISVTTFTTFTQAAYDVLLKLTNIDFAPMRESLGLTHHARSVGTCEYNNPIEALSEYSERVAITKKAIALWACNGFNDGETAQLKAFLAVLNLVSIRVEKYLRAYLQSAPTEDRVIPPANPLTGIDRLPLATAGRDGRKLGKCSNEVQVVDGGRNTSRHPAILALKARWVEKNIIQLTSLV